MVGWLPGEPIALDRLADPAGTARQIGAFITVLQQIDPTGGPEPGVHNAERAVPLANRDAQVRACIADLEGQIDTRAAEEAWETALAAEPWDGPPLWIHGDLQSGNLLVNRGRLTAVIDFGLLGVGDPACDLRIAWNLFTAQMRAAFREALPVDAAMWQRGRGWALSVALIALPYYQHTNPVLASISRRTIDEVLATAG